MIKKLCEDIELLTKQRNSRGRVFCPIIVSWKMDSYFQTDLASVREQFESDFLIWRREHEAAFKIREVERENDVRNQCRLERDKQIDEIIAKVDSEALKSQNEFESKILLVTCNLAVGICAKRF